MKKRRITTCLKPVRESKVSYRLEYLSFGGWFLVEESDDLEALCKYMRQSKDSTRIVRHIQSWEKVYECI